MSLQNILILKELFVFNAVLKNTVYCLHFRKNGAILFHGNPFDDG